jgi:hypothetical protein
VAEFFGWALLVVAALLIYRTLRPGQEAAARSARRWLSAGGLACVVLGAYLALVPHLVSAQSRPVDMSHPDDWIVGGPLEAIRWEDGRLKAKLVVESESYAAFPVDWRADAFRAAWDMTITHLDLRPEWGERASIAVGIFDTAAASIDDPDHVGGSALEACFSDDIRLRASDADRLLKTHSSTELSVSPRFPQEFHPSAPVTLQLNVPYHCLLTYDSVSDAATLTVTQGGKRVAQRELKDLREFTTSVAWFGVTVRGFKHRNKQKEAALKAAYAKPYAEVVIENLRYEQP